MRKSLFDKYNVPVPRYTSYPTVPNWTNDSQYTVRWLDSVNAKLSIDPELSLYIHLPFCENLCTYCACNKRITKQHSVEQPYINALIQEWRLYIEALAGRPVIKELHLGGGTPTFFSPKELDRLLSTLFSMATVAAIPNFSFEAHPNSTSIEHLQVLYDQGFKRISIGVQDINPNVLKAINRNQDTKQIINLTRQARSIGYESVNYDIIYGLPFQKEKDIAATTDLIADLKPDRIAFYGYAHVPWKSKGQRAFTTNDIASGYSKQKLGDLGRQRLIKSGYAPIAMDHFSLPTDNLFKAQKDGFLSRNFMGFTDTITSCLIGLGCSSISECKDMYIQNEHQVEVYQTGITSGKIPIIKGHILSTREQRVKEHITNLICQNETFFIEDELDRRLLNSAESNLTELKGDGIVEIGSSYIRITTIGRPFVRNVCSAIDPYQQQYIAERKYSAAI